MAMAGSLRQRLGAIVGEAAATPGLYSGAVRRISSAGGVASSIPKAGSCVGEAAATPGLYSGAVRRISSAGGVASSIPKAGGCIGVASSIPKAGGSITKAGGASRGFRPAGSASGVFPQAGSGPALLRSGAPLRARSSSHHVRTRAFSVGAMKDAAIKWLKDAFEKGKLAHGKAKLTLEDAHGKAMKELKEARLELRFNLVLWAVMKEDAMRWGKKWYLRYDKFHSFYVKVSSIAAAAGVIYTLNMSPKQYLGLVRYLHEKKGKQIKADVEEYLEEKKSGAKVMEVELRQARVRAVAAWDEGIAAAKKLGREEVVEELRNATSSSA